MLESLQIDSGTWSENVHDVRNCKSTVKNAYGYPKKIYFQES